MQRDLPADRPGLDALHAARLVESEAGWMLRSDQEGLDRLGDPLEPQWLDAGEARTSPERGDGCLARSGCRPDGAAAWMRAARLTVSPTTTNSCPWRSSSELTTTSPVSIPTRMANATLCSSAISRLRSSSPARMPNAARIARCGSSSRAWCRPKTAMTASPMNFSTTPPAASISWCHRWKYTLMIERVSSGSRACERTVKSTTSANSTVTSLRCSAVGRASRAARFSRSGASAVSTTSLPKIARWPSSAAMARSNAPSSLAPSPPSRSSGSSLSESTVRG